MNSNYLLLSKENSNQGKRLRKRLKKHHLEKLFKYSNYKGDYEGGICDEVIYLFKSGIQINGKLFDRFFDTDGYINLIFSVDEKLELSNQINYTYKLYSINNSGVNSKSFDTNDTYISSLEVLLNQKGLFCKTQLLFHCRINDFHKCRPAGKQRRQLVCRMRKTSTTHPNIGRLHSIFLAIAWPPIF